MSRFNLAGCVILKNDSILLLHRIKNDLYELPGGKIDEKESPEETAHRELKEELSCDIKITGKIGHKDFEENGFTMGYVWFKAEIKNGQEPKIGEPEKFSDFKYVPIKDIESYKLSINMQNFLRELKDKNIHL